MENASGGSRDPLQLQRNSSEGPEDQTTDIRKRKRMLSNRESAKRSRQRKQKHVDDLTVQVNQLKSQNCQILASVNVTTQVYLKVEAENSVLRAQLMELSNRLQSLNDIIHCVSTTTTTATATSSSESDPESFGSFDLDIEDCFPMNMWEVSYNIHADMSALNAFIC